MLIRYILFVLLFAFVVLGCEMPTSTELTEPVTTIQPGVVKQPEPSEPRLTISVSGVTDDTLITVRIHTLEGRQTQWGTFKSEETGALWESPWFSHIWWWLSEEAVTFKIKKNALEQMLNVENAIASPF